MFVFAADLRCEEGVQKSGTADQTRGVSSEVTCCVVKRPRGIYPLLLSALATDVLSLPENILDTSIPSTPTPC